jgi:phage baseplate assembly protein W
MRGLTMGSLIVKLDKETTGKLKNMHHYSDVDMLSFNSPQTRQTANGTLELIDVPMVYDVEAVKQSVRNILMWRVGESVISPEFGHNLKRSMYEQINDFNKDKVCEEIKRAIEENEPRARVNGVHVDKDEPNDGSSDNTLQVTLTYTVIGDKADGAKITETTRILGK